jgi:hypothetical protein
MTGGGEQRGRLRDGLMLVVMEIILSLGDRGSTTTPGGFLQRVRKGLQIKELSCWQVQESAQGHERKGDRQQTMQLGAS